MSEGPRLPLGQADRACAALLDRWGMTELLADHTPACMVVGSVRRRCVDVGDLELVAPLPPAWQEKKIGPAEDGLFRRINATMRNPWRPPTENLFLVNAPDVPQSADPIGVAVTGLKPGFLLANLRLEPKHLAVRELACQVYRYTPQNRGWMLIERTGPKSFGKWFLWKWKQAFGIPVGDARFKASVENHLVNLDGKVVPVHDEAEAFRLARVNPVPPEHRDDFMERLQARSGRPQEFPD